MSVRARVLLALLLALGAIILTLGFAAALGSPLWQADGVGLCVATNYQGNPQIVSDGSGGAIVTWNDYRSGNADIYAQRVNGNSNALWQADGVSLCVAINNQEYPQTASDGSGGAIVTWKDQRGSDDDIYARRVDQDGNALWDTDGVSLCVASDDQWFPQILSDGSGGAIVTWEDYRPGYPISDIYAQRVDGNGNTLWVADGVSVCVASNYQYAPQIVSDGSGGAIMTWSDERDYFTTGADIYAQRVDGNGNALWDTDGVSLCVATDSQYIPQIVSDGSGGAIVTWYDYRSGSHWDIYAQRVDDNGNALWQTDGVSLCVATDSQYTPQIVSDGSEGAIVTWQDSRPGSGDGDIYAQRVDSNGNALWDTDGVSLCVATDIQWKQQIVSDGSGGAIVTWRDYRDSGTTGYDIYAQRVDGDGNALWQANGVSLCVATNNQYEPQIASDGYWGAIVTWHDYRDAGTTGYDIYAQRVGGVANINLPLVMRKYP